MFQHDVVVAVVAEEIIVSRGAVENVVGNAAHDFHDDGQVVLLSRRSLITCRIEEVISRDQLEDHTRETPHIRAEIVTGLQNNFGGAVLSRLDLLGEGVIDVACVTEVSYFELNIRMVPNVELADLVKKLLGERFLGLLGVKRVLRAFIRVEVLPGIALVTLLVDLIQNQDFGRRKI